jgi:hypothetical protein
MSEVTPDHLRGRKERTPLPSLPPHNSCRHFRIAVCLPASVLSFIGITLGLCNCCALHCDPCSHLGDRLASDCDRFHQVHAEAPPSPQLPMQSPSSLLRPFQPRRTRPLHCLLGNGHEIVRVRGFQKTSFEGKGYFDISGLYQNHRFFDIQGVQLRP